MKNIELQKLLKKYPDSIEIKLMPTHQRGLHGLIEFTEENILKTSEKAYVDNNAHPDIWDCEDGKIRHKGKRYLLINPIIT